MSTPSEIHYDWICTNHELEEFVQFAQQTYEYYLDTEFHREKTYYPQLALIQIASAGRIAVIDPISTDAKLLRPLLEGPHMCILHAGQQDLDVLTQSIGFIPSQMLDTQLCAGFIGYSQPSLASLLQAKLKIDVPKGDRLTDWLRRPLTKDQLRYAASDVAYLAELSKLIFDELEERGRMQWARDACEELRTRPTGPHAPQDAWLRVKDVRTLKGKSRWVAQAVAHWREERAMDLDLPPRHVLSDIAILGVSQRTPRTTEDLLQSRGVDNRHANGAQGRAILEAISEGLKRSTEGDLSFPSSDGDDVDKSLRPAATLVSAWITELARQSDLDAGLLGTRKDITDLLNKSDTARLRHGWRAEIVGNDIEDLVAGRKALTFSPDNGAGLRLVSISEP